MSVPTDGSPLLGAVRFAWSVCTRRDRLRLQGLTTGIAATAILDVLAVLALGVTSALLIAAAQGGAPQTPVPLPSSIETRQGEELFDPALTLLVLAVTLLLVKSALSIVLSSRLIVLTQEVGHRFSVATWAGLVHRPNVVLGTQNSNATAHGLNYGAAHSTSIVLAAACLVASDAFLIAALALTILIVSPIAGVTALATFGVTGWLFLKWLSPRAQEASQEVTEAIIAADTAVRDGTRVFREVAAAGQLPWLVSNFETPHRRWTERQGRLLFLLAVPRYAAEIVMVLSLATVAAVASASSSPAVAAAVLVAFAGAASRILPAVVRIQSAVVQIRVGSSGAAATRQLLARIADDEVMAPAALVISGFSAVEPSAACELHNVSFEYAPGVPALRNVSLDVPSGHLVAITGPSGAGKSTLVDVLLGFLRPSEGFVSVLGAAPSLVRFEAGEVAYVPQESALVVGTIRDNLALGRPISDDQVLKALDVVGLSDLIYDGGGLDATLTERGANLSGGQRQRLGLARALLGKPQLLVLDEATSALDADSEQLISNALESLRGTVTIIVVAHRLHTVESADTIVYLEGGELVELGTFAELSGRMPGFAQYAALQSVGGSAAPGRLSDPTRAGRDERQVSP